MNSEEPGQRRQPVDWQQIDRVHRRNPQEDGERERRDVIELTVDKAASLLVDPLDQQFDRQLQLSRHSSGGAASGEAQENQDEGSAEEREEDGVPVDHREIKE